MNGVAADGTLTMKILVLNAGSSSQKSCLYEFKAEALDAPSRPLWEAEIDWTHHQGLAELKVATAHGASLCIACDATLVQCWLAWAGWMRSSLRRE